MLISDWPNALAHVDADAFYAACERGRRPDLAKRPVCVLSNHGAMIIAKTYDAKARGITTGMPVWEAKKRLPEAAFLPADFGYYGLMSDQMFAIFRRYSPEVEVYSIDEGFLGLNGLRCLWRKGYGEIADHLRSAVQSELGITVSVGISVTKTLAKIASDLNKPNGTTLVPGRQIESLLGKLTMDAIPGIGRNRAALLQKFQITTALEFARTPAHLMRRLLGKIGVDLRTELRGEPVFPLELEPKLPKSIARTASLGQVTQDKAVLVSALTYHTYRLAIELVTKRYAASRVTVTLQQQSFQSVGAEVRFPYPTANYFSLCKAVLGALTALYHPAVDYRGCGVMVTQICSTLGEIQQDIFGIIEKDARQGELFVTVDQINRKYGAGTIKIASAHLPTRRETIQRLRYPLLEVDMN